MDARMYSEYGAEELMKELQDMVYDIRYGSYDAEIPPEFSILLAEIDERLFMLEDLNH